MRKRQLLYFKNDAFKNWWKVNSVCVCLFAWILQKPDPNFDKAELAVGCGACFLELQFAETVSNLKLSSIF